MVVAAGMPCPSCATRAQQASDQARGSYRQRGYGRLHRTRFRPAVLERDPVCVLCELRLATVADHYPLSRRQLVEAGKDPDDPAHGRGLCTQCDRKQTAQRQPGGWNDRGEGASRSL
jgi:5-methylcytosine-specific restriction protein A